MPTNQSNCIPSAKHICPESNEAFRNWLFSNAVDIFYLNEGKQFQPFDCGTNLLSMATDGLLPLQFVSADQVTLKFEAITQARFSILFAIEDRKGVWRLRFRAVLTRVNGLLIFKLHSTLAIESNEVKLSAKDLNNAIALIGLRPKKNRIDAMCTIYAKENQCNGSIYRGTFGYKIEGGTEQYDVSTTLDGNLSQPTRYFNPNLKRDQTSPLSTFMEQRTTPVAAAR